MQRLAARKASMNFYEYHSSTEYKKVLMGLYGGNVLKLCCGIY